MKLQSGLVEHPRKKLVINNTQRLRSRGLWDDEWLEEDVVPERESRRTLTALS
jgi:hypothetical protein